MNKLNPLTGSTSTRKRRVTMPSTQPTSHDGAIIRYKSLGSTMVAANTAGAVMARWYCGGLNARIANAAGPDVVSYYATSVFRPGSSLRWEPTVSPTVGGRMFVGFTTNPEVMVSLYNALEAYEVTPNGTTYAGYSNLVKGLSNTMSFPMWMEKEIQIPTKLRRKRFDCNSSIAVNAVNDVDRSVQVAMFACADGFTGISTGGGIGSFWYNDVVDVEGLNGTAT